jgi:serine/threonine-protein kinase
MMIPERWQRVKAIFHDASERPASGRAAFLDVACAGDAELRREVESLLAADDREGEFLAQPLLPQNNHPTAQTGGLEPGRMIGEYRIERRLGAGGMGVVYLARDTQLGRPVALKLLRAGLTQDATRVRRFRQEARAASALNHPNIITIYEVGQADAAAGGAHFIAAEFVDGRTLREQCQSGGMTLGTALEVLIQITGALATAHEAGIVHRDIKPENVMLRRDGIAKVLDFGLAKLTEQAMRPPTAEFARVTTQPGLVMGTVRYMSPEQARGLEVDGRSDLFSLGVLMYELLTGHAPFEGETTADQLACLLHGEPRSLARHVPGLPAALQEITSRALAKPVVERYQTAREIGEDLKRLKEDLEFTARLKDFAGSQDDLLTMTVGAVTSKIEQTTFATHQITQPAALATWPVKTDEVRPIVTRPASRFSLPSRWLCRYGKMLAGAALVLLLIWAAHWRFWRAPHGDTLDSVAVLPFANVGGDPRMEYLPDGLTESLIDNLFQFPALRVMAHSTVFIHKGRDLDPRQVGNELKVKAVVTGRVQRQGEMLDIRVEMVDTRTGAQLWSELYQHPASDLLKLQEEITREIAEKLRLRLSGDEKRQMAKRYTRNTEAYSLYLQGRFHWNKRSGVGMRKSIEFFQRAIAMDSGFALAYVGLADANSTLGSYHLEPPREVLPQAREAAERALALDDQLAEAHASMGKILTDYYWDWARAESELQLALRLNPNDANARRWYAVLLASLGRFDESVVEARHAVELDLSPVASTELGNVLYRARRYDEAISVLRKTLDIEPNFVSARAYLALCYSMQGRHEEALAESQNALAVVPTSPDLIGLLGCAAGLASRRDQAQRSLQELNVLAKRTYVSPSSIAALYTALNEKDAAFEWLEKCYTDRSATIRALKTDPLCDSLRQDPRFDSLLQRAGFAP